MEESHCDDESEILADLSLCMQERILKEVSDSDDERLKAFINTNAYTIINFSNFFCDFQNIRII